MRLKNLGILILALAGLGFGQDTNFAAGPQYLITNGSPLTLRSIATPSLSLGESVAFESPVAATGTLAGDASSVPSAPSDTFLGAVYWGKHKDEVIVSRRLETPSMTPSETALYMEKVVSEVNSPLAPPEQSAVVGPIVIEIAGSRLPSSLPASILGFDGTGTTYSQSLVATSNDVSLGDVAAIWKLHKRAVAYVFTNADLHPHG